MKEAVLTGDVINSRNEPGEVWLPILKQTLGRSGHEPKEWEVFRGDSFQLRVSPQEALEAALAIKLAMMQFGDLNARIAIGIGEEGFQSDKITESNGEAFVLSGKTFDQMKKRTLALSVKYEPFNQLMNVMLDFATFLIDGWSKSIVKVVITTLDHPEMNQSEIAALLGVSQANISETYSRAGLDKVMNMLQIYRKLSATL
ncbi:MAG: transcriptional regulator [Flammeovirgaceae bacterium]|nr:transcriptional regulator [Flammeovirgaceae bacterium]HCX22728.1 transcriptional regulator [Cytophagales bacterium]|tara:strand:- start:107 stop:709 length:603 start_codon:yes stop_codon:yes gene_type:complete